MTTQHRPPLSTDLDCAIDYFRPILQSLQIRRGTVGFPVFLQSFPHLWNIDNSGKWVLTVLKAKLNDSKAKFVSKYYPNSGIMMCYIILDESCFINARAPNELRKIVVVHEFCHFLALLYACISNTEEVFKKNLKKRLSKIIDELTNDNVSELFRLLNNANLFNEEEFSIFEQTRDSHFRLNYENLDLSYTELFRNFMLSRQMFDDFFSRADRDNFSNLLKSGNVQEAFDLYINIAKRIAQEKWLPEKFALSQAVYILINYYLNNIIH